MSTPPLHSGLRQWKLAGAIISNTRLLDVLMSVTYFAIGFSPITALAIAIIGCIVLTLRLAPHGQEMLIKLTLTTLSLSLLGHIIYGLALGILFPYVCREGTIGVELSHYTVGADLSRPWPIDRPSL